MTSFILRIFHFLSRHNYLRMSLLVLSSIFIIFFGVQIEYEEDLSRLLPSSNNGNEKMAFSSLRVKDKIFILFSAENEEETDPDLLVEVADEFVSNILEHDTATHYIDDVFYQLEEDAMLDGLGYICENFPLFVDKESYEIIDSLLTQESINEVMQKNFEMLTSSAGMMFKDMLSHDPIGLRRIIASKFNEIKSGMGSDQTMYDSHFFTPDTAVAVAYLSPSFKSFDSKSGTELVKLIEQEIKSIKKEYPDVKIQFHGAPVQSVFNSRQIKADLTLTVTISLIFVFLIIGYCFRNKSTIPLLLAPVVYGGFFSLTMLYFIKGSMSLMALGLGAVVLGVALSYCLHLMTHYKYVSTPEQVIRDEAKPVFLGCLTTIGSFLGLLFTQSDLLKDFGLFASFALIGTTFFSLIFLPHFMNPERNRRAEKAFKLLERVNAHEFERHKWLIVVIFAVCIVCFYTQRFVTFDAELKNIGYFDESIMESMRNLAKRTQPGFETKYYASAHEDLDSAIFRSRLIDAKLDSLKNMGEINGYSKAPRLFMTEAEQQECVKNWKEYWTPEKIADVRQMVNRAAKKCGITTAFFKPFYDLLTKDYEPQRLNEAGVIPDGLLANMIEYTDGIYLIFTSVQLKTEMGETVGKCVSSVPDCIVIDPMFYASEMVKTINNDFHIALNISMAFVFVVLLLSLRNVILAILAFIPMALSWYIVLGVMGIFGLQFNLINIVISTFIFGIGVDYSIFVMDGLLKKTKSKDEERLLVYHKTAIFFSAVILIISTGSLLLAKHPALASIGVATLIGMSSAVILAYTLQPFLFKLLLKIFKGRWMRVGK